MNRLQDLVSPGGSRNRGSGADSWLGLLTDMMVLPFRMFGMGMQLMTRSTQEMQRLGTGGLGGVTSRTPQPPPRPQPPPQPSPAFSAPAYVPPPPGVGSGSSASAVPNLADTTNKEEKDMSCDKDLSGTDLKIVEYSIVSVEPNLPDDRRIIVPTKTIATTQDLDESGFTAWVIADNCGSLRPSQYLRVCYCVQCRFPVADANWDKQQTDALIAINQTLKDCCEQGSVTFGSQQRTSTGTVRSAGGSASLSSTSTEPAGTGSTGSTGTGTTGTGSKPPKSA